MPINNSGYLKPHNTDTKYLIQTCCQIPAAMKINTVLSLGVLFITFR